MVDDLDAWLAQPWGLGIADVVDASGVLWHVAQRRADVVHDA